MEATTKIRYKDKGALIKYLSMKMASMSVHFYENVKGIAPGQSAVFYEGDDVLGGGIIQSGALEVISNIEFKSDSELLTLN